MPPISAGVIAFLLNAAAQIAIVCIGTTFALFVLRSAPARVKHRIAITGLTLCACAPIMSAWATRRSEAAPMIGSVSIDARPLAADGIVAAFIYVYIAILVWKAIAIARGFVSARALRRTCTPIVDGPVVDAFHKYSTDGRIQVCRSPQLRTPLIVGWLNPLIVVPGDLAEGDPAVIDAVIAHECAHAARYDVPIAAAIEISTLPFALHPAVVMLKRIAAKDRELACDEDAIERLRITRRSYATALLSVAEFGMQPLAVGAGIGSHLEQRVRELLADRGNDVSIGKRAVGYAVMLLAFGIAPLCAVVVDGGWRNLTGAWTLDVDRSEPHGHVPFQAARMRIDTTGHRLLIAQQRTRADGRVETFEIRGTADDVPFKVYLPGSAAMQTRARWEGNRLITDAEGPGRRLREHGEAVADGDRLVITTERAFDNARTKYQLVFRRE